MSAPPCRFAIVGTPRSGNTWLRLLLADACGIAQIAVHDAVDVAWDGLPDAFVLQLHARATGEFRQRLAHHGIRPVVLARHPLDVLISILQFASAETETERWLDGEEGDEGEIVDATPTDGVFLRYAMGRRAEVLLSLTPDWIAHPACTCLRYEDLVSSPQAVLDSLIDANVQSPDQIAAAIRRHELDALRARIGARHVWQGRPGLWRSVLPAEPARRIAHRHETIMHALDYRCDPDDSLTPAHANARWASLVRCDGATPIPV